MSPYQIRYGREPRSVLEHQLGVAPEPGRVEDHAHQIVAEVSKGIRIAHEARERARQDLDRRLQVVQRIATFEVGDPVMIERMDRKTLQTRYSGPYRVIKQIDDSNFLLDLPGGPGSKHMAQLKKFPGELPIEKNPERGDDAEWEEAPSSERKSLNHANIVGRRIRSYWPQFREWFDGIVMRRSGNRHEVFYWDVEDHLYLESLIGYRRGTRWKLLRPRTAASLRGGVSAIRPDA